MSGNAALQPLALAPLFMPTPDWVPVIKRSGAKTVQALIEDARVEFSGDVPSSERLVVLRPDWTFAPGELGPLLCEAGPNGAVLITISASLSSMDAARQGLAVLAYVLFDTAARCVVRGQPWSRINSGETSVTK